MVGRTASVISPFYSLLPGWDKVGWDGIDLVGVGIGWLGPKRKSLSGKNKSISSLFSLFCASTEMVESIVSGLINRYVACQPLVAHLERTELRPCDGYLVIASHLLWEKWEITRNIRFKPVLIQFKFFNEFKIYCYFTFMPKMHKTFYILQFFL